MSKSLLTIGSVRATNTPVFNLIFSDDLENFDSHFSKENLETCLDFIVSLIERDFGDNYSSIPPHGRWQHFEVGNTSRVGKLVEQWQKEGVSETELTKKLIDLFVVSVFLDAGAGDKWCYKESETGAVFSRSEGLAVASYYMFKSGSFSEDSSDPYRVDAEKLSSLEVSEFVKEFQISASNPLVGTEGRLNLLKNLGTALTKNPEIFGYEGTFRPGNIVHYLDSPSKEIDLNDLWNSLMKGFNSIWSSRIVFDGVSLGDAWYSKSRAKISAQQGKTEDTDKIVSFHKLTQWLTYSLLTPLKKYGKFTIKNESLLTGLPEYRNGGLLIDFGLLSIKEPILTKGLELTKKLIAEGANLDPLVPSYEPDDDLIVEWRSCTIGFLDYILPLVNEKLGLEEGKGLALAQLIEAGSWKAGREIAAKKRSNKGAPINLYSDGTVF